MDTRIAVLSIIIEEPGDISAVNELLHDYARYAVGRMGIPYRRKQVNIISLVLDAPQDAVSELSGKLGRLENISVKVAYAKK